MSERITLYEVVCLLNSRERVRRVFRGGAFDRAPFLPCATSYAARLNQTSLEELLEDPTALANSLQSTAAWLGADATIGPAITEVEARACGWPDSDLDPDAIESGGQVPVIVEALRRLKIVVGKEKAIFAGQTGPLALARQFAPDLDRRLADGDAEAAELLERAAKAVVRLARKYSELQLDGIMVFEVGLSTLPEPVRSALKPHLRSLWNVTRYYDQIALLNVGADDAWTACKDLGAGALAGPPVLAWTPEQSVVGAVLDPGILSGDSALLVETVGAFLERSSGRRAFLLTAGEIPTMVAPEHLRALAEVFSR